MWAQSYGTMGVCLVQEPATQTQDPSEINESGSSFLASLYRTRWLMAHNRLHAVVYGSSVPLTESWKEYLNELQQAGAIARRQA